jgi:hypothetical protein
LLSTVLCALAPRRTTLWNRANLLFTVDDCIRDIERTVAGTVFRQVRIPVVAGTYDVQILLLVPFRKPARASPVAIPLLVDQEALHQPFGELHIGIEVVAACLGLSPQLVV